ncbi:Retrovirus-related Pol polyprotein from transposon TNT 1-94 [Araneus ventricosus]|uniref:Retrovirus-related Pol polyprotein from transposon TNT 1-94 n=1 Tax=Araneus ventricosus TaxID=182803 RepID=A0A4Y2IWA5_ARAVE|nr:Retrovirus-related Pol polyprotein from transposon TNT 1-94 [Araneus ventricosus]
MGGNRYFLSITDDYSRKVDVYIIKSKDQVFDCFKKYLAKVERELNSKIKSMRSDSGLEFCNKEIEKFLTKLSFKTERTSIYTPEQNGIAEKFNRTAMDGVRAMLYDSGLQPKFWAEALLTIVHAKNRCEHKLTSPRTTIEIWSGFKPSERHFRIFGSLAYVHIPKFKINKLQPRAKLGILVGYSLQTKGYRIFLPNENKVIETINVYIDESKN